MDLLKKLSGEEEKEKTPEDNLQRLFETEKELKEGVYNKKEITKRRNKERENYLKGENETISFFKNEIGGVLGAIIGALMLLPRFLVGNAILAIGAIILFIIAIIIIALLPI